MTINTVQEGDMNWCTQGKKGFSWLLKRNHWKKYRKPLCGAKKCTQAKPYMGIPMKKTWIYRWSWVFQCNMEICKGDWTDSDNVYPGTIISNKWFSLPTRDDCYAPSVCTSMFRIFAVYCHTCLSGGNRTDLHISPAFHSIHADQTYRMMDQLATSYLQSCSYGWLCQHDTTWWTLIHWEEVTSY